MVIPAVKKQILDDLDRLSPERQRRAAALVHELTTPLPPGTPGKDLLRFVGTLDDESAREMLEAIEDGCEQIDPDGW
jgi:signal transduction histidine kinase